MCVNPLPHFMSCKMCLMIRGNIVCETTELNKAIAVEPNALTKMKCVIKFPPSGQLFASDKWEYLGDLAFAPATSILHTQE